MQFILTTKAQWDHIQNLADELREALAGIVPQEFAVEVEGGGTHTPPTKPEASQEEAKYVIARGKDTYGDAVWGELGDKPFTTSQAWNKILPKLDTGDTEPVRSSLTRALSTDPRFKKVGKKRKASLFQKRTQEEIEQLTLEENK